MILSERQEKQLIELYWNIYYYSNYLEKETYHPYEEVKGFAENLKKIINNDDKINSLKP
jgi:hypothetical protein